MVAETEPWTALRRALENVLERVDVATVLDHDCATAEACAMQRRRLQGLGAWQARWLGIVESWYMSQSAPTQAELSSCLSTLALHIDAKLDTWARNIQRGLGKPSNRLIYKPLPSQSIQEGCEWVAEGDRIQLPSFPALPENVNELPPVPRLVPTAERLNELRASAHDEWQVADHDGAPAIGTDDNGMTVWMVASSAGGFMAGAALAVIFSFTFVRVRRRLGKIAIQPR